MRERPLQTADGRRHEARLTPADADLPTSPGSTRLPEERRSSVSAGQRASQSEGETPSQSPYSGLEPTETVSHPVDAGPVSALRYQEFAALPLQHAATAAGGDPGPRVVATLANESGEPWAYRVPRSPAPFAGGRATTDGSDAELRASPAEEPSPLTDGVLRPGESIRSTVSVSALAGAEPGWPGGEYTFLQPLTVWTDERAYSYNWRITLRI